MARALVRDFSRGGRIIEILYPHPHPRRGPGARVPSRRLEIRRIFALVGWVEPTGRANARPMTGSAIPIISFIGANRWVSLRSTHPTDTLHHLVLTGTLAILRQNQKQRK